MPDRRTMLLDVVNSIIQQLEEVNGVYVGDDEDTAIDLSDNELETLIAQLQDKSNRPRHIVGAI